MARAGRTGLALSWLLIAAGCASTTTVGHSLARSGPFYETYGHVGHNGHITIASESRLEKLSIIGNANTFIVENGATVGKIEVWGRNNTISIPEHLHVRESLIGEGNQIIRRSWDSEPPIDPSIPISDINP